MAFSNGESKGSGSGLAEAAASSCWCSPHDSRHKAVTTRHGSVLTGPGDLISLVWGCMSPPSPPLILLRASKLRSRRSDYLSLESCHAGIVAAIVAGNLCCLQWDVVTRTGRRESVGGVGHLCCCFEGEMRSYSKPGGVRWD